MLLKKLELYGFKSFAEKTSLEFEPGITAIVGPNGCGKSNIVDAIKWVLGEQSAKELRGSNMEDVIFSGSEHQERVNFAEVSLQISNEDGSLPIEFSEVTISRRLFRSGESEYLINRVPVRLRDVQELIAGTGIGTKAYSLMEQGKMDLLLSSKPEERRFVFEEASGITKFKNKKKEALRKLEHTENNLLRVSDVISEIRRQISSLERQARRAEKYRLLYQELKQKEIQLANLQIEESEKQISSYHKEKERIESEHSHLAQLLQEKEAKARELREKFSLLSEEIGEKENQLQELKAQLKRNLERIDWNKEAIVENRGKSEALKSELEGIEKRRLNLEQRIGEAERERAHFQKEEEKLQAQLEERERALSSLDGKQALLKKEIEEVKSKILEQNLELTQRRNLLLELETEIKSLRVRLSRLEQELRQTLSEIEREESEIEEVRIELEEKKAKLKEMEEKRNRLSQERERLLRKKGELEEEKEAREKELAVSTTLISSWREISSQGLIHSQELKLALDSVNSEFLGFLSQILKVAPENQFLVELAYRSYLDAVVLTSRKAAFNLLPACRERAISEVNILILEEMKEYKLQQVEGAIPVASFVQIEPSLRNLLSLIDDVFYIPQLEKAQEMSLKHPELKFISGENIIFQQGKITLGPSPAQSLGYIDREGKIKRLEEKIACLNESSLELTQKIGQLEEEILTLSRELQELEKRKQEIEHAVISLSKALENREANKKRLLEEKEVVDLELEELRSQLEGDLQREKRLGLELGDRQSLLKQVEEKLSSLQNELVQIGESRQALSLEVVELQARKRASRERKEQFQAYFQSLLSEMENLKNGQERRKQELLSASAKLDELEREIESLERENLQLDESRKKLELKLDEERKSYSEQKSEFEREEDALLEMRNRYTSRKDELHDIELKIQEEEYKVKSIRDRLAQRYNIFTLPEADSELPGPELLQQEIEQIRERLEKMGEVNLVAIEEHRQLQERLSFLETQEKDLLEAKESLIAAIRKINRTTRQMFSQTFQEVRKAFKEIFPRLFGGGDADLVLEEGVDCLEAGIEILARPSGKRLQSVSLLSGGEKALTALSLLFAIFKVKPSPFCILDEVDAPLDESNIDRFRKLLEEFASFSQFLVITHNKRTISTADVIYGITMEESGVSKLVSAKFQKAREATPAD